jgi:hypothetical protein
MVADLGTVPAWVSAIGTTSAFAVSLAVLRGSQLDRRRQTDAAVRMQAALVSAWVPVREQPRLVRVRNSSAAAVDDAFIFIRMDVMGRPIEEVEYPLGTLPPETTVDVPVLGAEPMAWSLAGLQFTDAAGLVWRRDVFRGLRLLFDPDRGVIERVPGDGPELIPVRRGRLRRGVRKVLPPYRMPRYPGR